MRIAKHRKVLPWIAVEDNETRRLADLESADNVSAAGVEGDETLRRRYRIGGDELQLVVPDQQVDRRVVSAGQGDDCAANHDILRIDNLGDRHAPGAAQQQKESK